MPNCPAVCVCVFFFAWKSGKFRRTSGGTVTISRDHTEIIHCIPLMSQLEDRNTLQTWNHIVPYLHTVTTFTYAEGGPDREARVILHRLQSSSGSSGIKCNEVTRSHKHPSCMRHGTYLQSHEGHELRDVRWVWCITITTDAAFTYFCYIIIYIYIYVYIYIVMSGQCASLRNCRGSALGHWLPNLIQFQCNH